MPIHGLTHTTGALPRIGELRKGTPKKTNARGEQIYGADQDFFRFTSENEPKLVEQFYAVYGAEPREIVCFLPYDTVDQNFEAWKYTFRASGVQVKCDGLHVCSLRNEAGNLVHYSPENAPACMAETGCYVDSKGKKHVCKPSGMLHIVIPALKRAGVVTVLTGSTWDISDLHKSLQFLHEKALRYGKGLSDIPMLLTRHVQRKSTPRADGSRARRPISLLRIEILPSWFAERQIGMATDGEVQLEEAVKSKMLQPRTYSAQHSKPNEDETSSYSPMDASEPDYGSRDVEDAVVTGETPGNGAVDMHAELQQRFIALGLVDEHEHKWATLCSLILGGNVETLANVTPDQFNTLMIAMLHMQKVFPYQTDNIKFIAETLEGFKAGTIKKEGWVFIRAVNEWHARNYLQQPEPEPAQDMPDDDNLPF